MTITAMTADRDSFGPWVLGGGFLVLFYVIFGWFKDQIREEAEGFTATSSIDPIAKACCGSFFPR